MQDLVGKLQSFSTIWAGNNNGPSFWQEDVPFSAYLDSFASANEAMQEEPRLVTMDAEASLFAYTAVGLRCSGPVFTTTSQPDRCRHLPTTSSVPPHPPPPPPVPQTPSILYACIAGGLCMLGGNSVSCCYSPAS